MESTRDRFGTEVVVGDRVIFAKGQHYNFETGYVKKITKRGVGINPTPDQPNIWNSNLCCWYREPSDFIKDTSCTP